MRYGFTTMCIGIGMGGTVIWENPRTTARRPAMREAARALESPDEIVTRRGLVPRPPRRRRQLALLTLDNGLDHRGPRRSARAA